MPLPKIPSPIAKFPARMNGRFMESPPLVEGKLPYTDVRMEVPYMAGERLEVRLDPERRRKLADIAEARGATVSKVVREMIDRAFDDSRRAERLRYVRQIAEARAEMVPDPEELSRQLDRTHDLPDLP
jgi:hypothetical protein